jgi:hypothetical protein
MKHSRLQLIPPNSYRRPCFVLEVIMPLVSTKAHDYIESVKITAPRPLLTQGPGEATGEMFKTTEQQAQLVGSALFSFETGVDAAVRQAISDSALLAQLVANQTVKFEDDAIKWFDTYSDVLLNLGWVLEGKSWVDQKSNGKAAEVHEQIIAVLGAVLGPVGTALSITTAAFNALKAMDPKSSWITLFSRETAQAKIAKFQVGLVETGPQSDVLVRLLACLIVSDIEVTGVLLFKWKTAHAKLTAKDIKVTVDRAGLDELATQVHKKVAAWRDSYVSSVLPLVLPTKK